ncbi:hypothetical protein BHM03_00056690 [Ensete ventricosum]|nr:hypothetical protein BHM03_00056690 [Ensete ventricosum]
MKGVDVEDGNIERKHGAFVGQSGGKVNYHKSEHNRRWQRSHDVLAEATRGEIYQRVPWRDLIIQRYDQSDSRVGLLQCLYLLKGAQQVRRQSRNYWENIEVLKQVVETGEEATMSPEGLGYPKAKRRSERRWTQRSAIIRAEAKELHKTGVDRLLVKIAESEGLRVDVGVLDQGTK